MGAGATRRMLLLRLIILLFTLGFAHGQQATPPAASFDLFPIDQACKCVAVASRTATIESSEITRGGKVFQVFKDRQTKRELFRVEIGDTRSKWWHYGITTEGDFNRDGIQDYAWYGGDDTSDELYVFLSSESGYRRLDIYKTMRRAWALAFHAPAPDFASSEGEYSLTAIRLDRDSTGLTLDADVESSAHPKAGRRHLHVLAADFVFSQ